MQALLCPGVGAGEDSRVSGLYATISEKIFTAQIIRMCQMFNWKVAHFRPAMTKRGKWVTAVQGDGAGFPDLVLIRDSRPIFAELKSAKGKLTAGQEAWLKAASNAGIEVYTWRPRDIDVIERILR